MVAALMMHRLSVPQIELLPEWGVLPLSHLDRLLIEDNPYVGRFCGNAQKHLPTLEAYTKFTK
jgi:hypothetical protein